jgi:phage-related protein
VAWSVEILDHRVVKELDALAQDVRQRFLRVAQLIEEHGMAAVHAFVKKTQRTPQGAMETARKRAKEVT